MGGNGSTQALWTYTHVEECKCTIGLFGGERCKWKRVKSKWIRCKRDQDGDVCSDAFPARELVDPDVLEKCRQEAEAEMGEQNPLEERPPRPVSSPQLTPTK